MRIFSLLILIIGLLACDGRSSNALRIGVVSGPETELLQVAKAVAKEQEGLEVKIVEFNDYHLLNTALNEGSIDANIFQHLPYLQNAIRAHHYPLEVLAKTFLFPMSIYSKKIKNLQQLPEGAIIAIPNDPSNEARALLLLQSSGLIKLAQDEAVSKADVKENPHHLILKEIEAAQLPRVLEDVDAAVINTNFAIPAGLVPSRDALFLESKDSPYANLIVIRNDSTKREQLEKFVKSYQSTPVAKKAESIFGGNAIPLW